jgi:hypothetical protein
MSFVDRVFIVMHGPGGEYIELIEAQPATLPAPASDDKP